MSQPQPQSPRGLAALLRFGLGANERGLLYALVAVIAVTAAIDSLHTYVNNPEASLYAYMRPTAMLGIFSLGAAVVIIAGGIDLSYGSVIAFSATVCAAMLKELTGTDDPSSYNAGNPTIAVAIAGTLLVGVLIGTLHAHLITKVGLPPFVATLATLVGLRSAARILAGVVTDGRSQVRIDYPDFRYLVFNSYWTPVVVFAVLALLTGVLLRRTVLGRHLYALGGNEAAARLSGIRTDDVKWFAYTFSAVLASLAGIFYAGETGVADPEKMGRAYELKAIAAAVVGGCSLTGGVGTVSGTVLGVFFLQAVIDGVNKVIKSGSDLYEGLVVGTVVILAVGFNQLKAGTASWNQVFNVLWPFKAAYRLVTRK